MKNEYKRVGIEGGGCSFKLFIIEEGELEQGLKNGNIIPIKNLLVGRRVIDDDVISIVVNNSETDPDISPLYIRRSYVDSSYKTIKMTYTKVRNIGELSFKEYDNLYAIFGSKSEAAKYKLTKD